MPDREGKTLDMSPVGLLGCAEVELVTRRFGILVRETYRPLAPVQSRRLCIFSFPISFCSLEESAEGLSMLHDAEQQSANSRRPS